MDRTATLVGTLGEPGVALTFAANDFHPRLRNDKGQPLPLNEWVRSLPGRHWDRERQAWVVRAFDTLPEKALRDAGFTIVYEPPGLHRSLRHTFNLDELYEPLVKADPSRENTVALIRPRFAGWSVTKERLPFGAGWNKERQLFEARLIDFVTNSTQHGRGVMSGLTYMGDTAERALAAALVQSPVDSSLAAVTATAALSTGLDLTDATSAAIDTLIQKVGDVPDWFAMPLYPYQRLGAVAAAAGRGLIADSPGLGKGQPRNSPILTPYGWTTYGSVTVGDKVVGANGRATRVKGVYPRGRQTVYRVTFSDGVSTVTDGDHLWEVRAGDRSVVRSTRELVSDVAEGMQWRVPMVEPVRFSMAASWQTFGGDPTVVGHMIADAAVSDSPVLVEFNQLWHRDPRQRAALLVAILDHSERGVFRTTSFELASQVMFLTQMLGGAAVKNVRDGVHEVVVNGEFAGRRFGDGGVRHIVDVTECGVDETVCIEVEAGDSLYVIEHGVVTHNTRQALAASAILNSQRTLIVVPPVVVTHWSREVEESRLAENCSGTVVMFRAGRKEPELPLTGVVVIPDSLMSSRPHLVDALVDWQPDVFVYDEAHRARNWTSKRSEVMRGFVDRVGDGMARICLTGTPLFAQPYELAPVLAMTGHLDPVFGGQSAFLSAFSRQNQFKQWVARKKELPRLKQILDEQVWVRRLKDDVLKDLPKKSRHALFVDVDLKDYRRAHGEVIDKVADWLAGWFRESGAWPTVDEQEAWARTQIGVISPLRKAAGVAKVPAALDRINDWVASNRLESPAPDGSLYDRPFLVWAHHQEVIEAMRAGIAAASKEVRGAVEVIDGSTSERQRASIVDRFQAGQVGVIIASITAAGVGITLTRGSDMLFVETDWTPALVSQAEDRQLRIGQTQPVIAETLIAEGTLDERVQQVLLTKAETLNTVLGGSEASVAVVSSDRDLAGPSDVVMSLMPEALKRAAVLVK